MKKRKKMFSFIDCLLILLVSLYVLSDTFLIQRTYAEVNDSRSEKEIFGLTQETSPAAEASISENSYEDDDISIHLEEYVYLDTVIYVADVKISSIDLLYSAFADDSYGRNVTDKVSEISEDNDAILAINGDYYGARNNGYVLRNGTIYRETSSGSDQEDLVILADGSFAFIREGETKLREINDALQVYSFGPALIEDYAISVDENDEVGKAMASNPRTAICEIEPLHYLFVVCDGRSDESEGLSLYELACFLEQFDVKNAYNLDGGGSSTMVFNGELINNPTTSGNSIKERSVSDAICIGY